MAYNRFGMPPVQQSTGAAAAPVSSAPITVIQRAQTWPLVAVALIAVILAVVAFVGAQLLSGSQTKDLQAQVDGMRAANSSLGNEIELLKDSSAATRKELDNLHKSRPIAATSVATTQPTPATAPSIANQVDALRKELETLSAAQKKATGEQNSDLKKIMNQINDLKDNMRKQQKSRFDSISKELDRLIKKTEEDGIDRQNSRDLNWLVAEFAALDDSLFDPNDVESLKKTRTAIYHLYLIIEIREKTDNWEVKTRSVMFKPKDDKAKVWIGIQAEVQKASLSLENVTPEQLDTIGVKDISVLKKRLQGVLKWVNDNRPLGVNPPTATS